MQRDMNHDTKYLVIRRDGTIPLFDWFVLGNTDPAAVNALAAYIQTAKELKYDERYIADIERIGAEWVTRGGRTTRPDEPGIRPWEDHPVVLDLLTQGETSYSLHEAMAQYLPGHLVRRFRAGLERRAQKWLGTLIGKTTTR